jgi:hypothetical protein
MPRALLEEDVDEFLTRDILLGKCRARERCGTSVEARAKVV